MSEQLQKMARNIAAKREASASGKNWEKMSPQEKQLAMKGAAVTPDDRERAIRWIGRRMAQQAGIDWNAATKEQRQSFVQKARAENKSP